MSDQTYLAVLRNDYRQARRVLYASPLKLAWWMGCTAHDAIASQPCFDAPSDEARWDWAFDPAFICAARLLAAQEFLEEASHD